MGFQHSHRIAAAQDGGEVVGFVDLLQEHAEISHAAIEHGLKALEAAGQQRHGAGNGRFDGRSFDQRVWDAVTQIPPGQLATYGQIADWIGAYGRARQVGWALRRLPLPSSVPWQRVVNARGCISFSGSREGSDWIQREMLIAEGIPVDSEGRLPLGRYLWRPDASP
jgi:methylated-DNA-protein-cysteine methyltransferase-like protein